MTIINAGIREAKIHLSKLLKHVKNGHEVILTDRGRPVGKIVPIKPTELPLEERIRRFEEKGLVKPLSGSSRYKMPQPIPVADNIAQKFLAEDRYDGTQ